MGNKMKVYSNKFYNEHLEFNTCVKDPSKSKYTDWKIAKSHQAVYLSINVKLNFFFKA